MRLQATALCQLQVELLQICQQSALLPGDLPGLVDAEDQGNKPHEREDGTDMQH